jgi:CBS domain-containing protein
LYYYLDESVSLLDIDVDHCQTKPVTISPEGDIFEALDLLKNTYAIIVVDNQKPVGILTDYDTTSFFRNLTEGLILVQDIEVTLKQYIEGVFPDENDLKEAILRAVKADENDSSKPSVEYEYLTLNQIIQVITTKGNWEKFEQYFKPRKVFYRLMDQVRRIRNQLAHFRGQLDEIQLNTLKRTQIWLENRPKLSVKKTPDDITIPDTGIDIVRREDVLSKGKYAPFEIWLKDQTKYDRNLSLKFSTIEEILGFSLPPSARKHRAWWSNDYKSHPHSKSWLSAGWLVDGVDLSTEQVVFRKSNLPLMQLFFAELIEKLKERRPGATRATKASLANWWAFGAGKSGISFAWVFGGNNRFRTELYIDTGVENINKEIFDRLYKQKSEIENQLGTKLIWERLDNKRASRISVGIPANINDDPERLNKVKIWAIDNMIKFIDVFRPRIEEIKIDVE